jgi:glycosyltransferase involved in cell wall biosynthesis
MKYSIIILLKFNNDDIVEFVTNLDSLFREQEEDFEILIIVDGMVVLSEEKINQLSQIDTNLRIFRLPARTTEAICLASGYRECRGETIVVLGSFQQITSQSLKQMIAALDDETDMVVSWRRNRLDGRFSQFQSRVFNYVVRSMVRTDLNDIACKVKVLRPKILDRIAIYGKMYNYLPILARDKGYAVKEVACDHYKDHRKPGIRSVSQYLNTLLDILVLYFNSKFNRKPLRFFSTVGIIFSFIGALIISYVFFEKLIFGTPIGERSVLLISLLFIVNGIQAASVGLLGEIIAFVHGRHRQEYTIEKII